MVHFISADPAVRRSQERLIGALGGPCRAWPSLARFCAAFDGRPGCVCIDLQGLDAGGVECFTILKERGIDLPVILLHGALAATERARLQELHAPLAFLVTPVSAGRLIAAIEAMLARGAQRGP